MKKGIISKLGAGAVVLTLVTASLVGGTFAKYTKTVSGTATATVAAFKFNEGLGSFTEAQEIKFGDKILPGSSNTIDIKVDSASDVKVDYQITVTEPQNTPDGFYLSTSNDDIGKINAYPYKTDMATLDEADSDTVTIYAIWPDKEIDSQDAKSITMDISVTGSQTQTP